MIWCHAVPPKAAKVNLEIGNGRTLILRDTRSVPPSESSQGAGY